MASQIPFKALNYEAGPPSASSTSFSLSTPSSVDIWRKPPVLDVFNAPVIYKSIALSKFKRVRVTISGAWETLFDQGGLVFVLPSQNTDEKQRWIKSGIEFYEGSPFVSTVGADRYADWSLLPVPQASQAKGKLTLEFERHPTDDTLWVYVIDEKEGKLPAREVTWALDNLQGDKQVWVGVYVAKPTKSDEGKKEVLDVQFEDFELELKD
ncbi:hypothetical protein PVAG01_03827 [Phlyctema vagabunda]|uniref:Uncharacterized protein n=1 Tax=Phlyctema vagabunda TaxID=108571 RepID=A0ABR4PMI0_9HELO